MENWKIVSRIVRCVVVANLALITGVLLFHGSRALGIKVFWAFRASAIALLFLVPTEYVFRRMQAAKWNGLILDTLLMAVMFGVWLTISAATF